MKEFSFLLSTVIGCPLRRVPSAFLSMCQSFPVPCICGTVLKLLVHPRPNREFRTGCFYPRNARSRSVMIPYDDEVSGIAKLYLLFAPAALPNLLPYKVHVFKQKIIMNKITNYLS